VASGAIRGGIYHRRPCDSSDHLSPRFAEIHNGEVTRK